MNFLSNFVKSSLSIIINSRAISSTNFLNLNRPLRREIKVYMDLDGNPDHHFKGVEQRFFRLRSGIYAHIPIPKYVRKHKPNWVINENKNYVLTGKDKSFLLDNMNNEYYRSSKFYPDDPFDPYHLKPGMKTFKKFYP